MHGKILKRRVVLYAFGYGGGTGGSGSGIESD